MNSTVVKDWMFPVALGASAGLVLLAWKLEPEDAKEVLIHGIDAFKEYAVAISGNC